MFQKAFLTILLQCFAMVSLAIPARREVVRMVTMPDGTLAKVTLCGDEYRKWWATGNGVVVKLTDDNRALIVDDLTERNLRAKAAKSSSDNNRRRASRLSVARKSAMAFEGDKRGIVILVNFSNKSMASATAHDDFNRMFNEVGYSDNHHVGSVKDYFADQSYGRLNIDFDIVGPVTLSQNYSYYGQNDAYDNDRYPAKMVIEACCLADAEVDFSQYDWDGDGLVDQVFVVYAGYSEADGASADTVWPHEWALSEAAKYGDGTGALKLDGVTVDTYAVTSELSGTRGKTMAGIGTACHEFSHCLGFPDFYDAQYNGGWGMDAWDVLAMGNRNGAQGNGEVPCGYTAYERYVAGWLTPKELKPGMKVEALKPISEAPEAYIIYNDAAKSEYYLLENRNATKWFGYVRGVKAPGGLLISHVDYDQKAWTSNTVNTNPSHQRMTMFLANNRPGQLNAQNMWSISETEYAGHLYPYGENDALTANSMPAATVFNANTDGQKLMNKDIRNIVRHDDGTISFECVSPGDNSENTGEGGTEQGTGTVIFYESFDQCDGAGGNDGRWSGAISTKKGLNADNNGWACDYSYKGDKCAHFGNGTNAGSATTPSFVLNGSATLTLNAAAWDHDSDETQLGIWANDHFVGAFEVAKGNWTPISTTITGHGETKLTFSLYRRFFLDEIKVSTGNTSGIDNKNTDAPSDNRVYAITGQPLGTDINALPKGVYIIKGKKIVKK